MEKEVFDYVAERAKILSKSGSSKKETQEAAQTWLDAVSANCSDLAVETATSTLLDYLDGRPNSIDGAIAFAKGPAKEMFGEEAATQMLEAQEARKAAGAKFCGCEACTAASEILAKFGRVEL